MNKHILFSFLALTFSTSLLAQRAISERISSKYISLPQIDVLKQKPSGFTAEMAIEDTEYTKELFTKKVPCMPSQGSLKDAQMVPIYFYSIQALRGLGYLVVRDGNGDIYYSEEFSNGSQAEKLIYGKEDCKFFLQELLESDYKENKQKWRNDDQQKFVERKKAELENVVKSKLTLYYQSQSVDVYTGKFRKFDYIELDKAQKQALEAYENIKEKGMNSATLDQLNAPIQTWNSIMSQVDWDNKKAKYNHRIGRAVLYNLAMANFYQGNFEKALIHALKADESYENMINDSRRTIQTLIGRINDQEAGRKANPDLANDLKTLHQKASDQNAKSITIKVLDKKDVGNLGAEHHFHQKDLEKERAASKLDAQRKSGINPYQERVIKTMGGGSMLIISILDEELTAIPNEVFELDITELRLGGHRIQEVSPDIGTMSDLRVLDLAGNELSSLL